VRIGYYPGCSLYSTFREGDESLRTIAPLLDVELAELDDWCCCGATSGHATNYLLSIALPARNLAIAENEGHDRVLAPCAACYNRLAVASHEMATRDEVGTRIRRIIDRPFNNSVRVCNVVDFLHEIVGTISDRVTHPLSGFKIACYYGCLLVRPGEVCSVDDREDPTTMEDVVRASGAIPVEWDMRLECCGAAFSLCRTDTVVRLSRVILEDARRAGADAVVVACPMCHSNLDFRQPALLGGRDSQTPILYLAELVGLALGADPWDLGFKRHFVNPRPFLRRVSVVAATVEAGG
jgi:heterodisulfide reductase subunit B